MRQANSDRRSRIQQPPTCLKCAHRGRSGTTTLLVVAVFGAICVAGVFVALILALRRLGTAPVAESLREIDGRLAWIDERISAAIGAKVADAADPETAIGSTLDLKEVLQRTLAAARELGAVDAGRATVRRPDGTVRTEVVGRIAATSDAALAGPPDGSPFAYGLASWAVSGSDELRAGLVVPFGDGVLAVYSRLANAFDEEAANGLAAIARRAEPAVQNAFAYLEIQERVATDMRTGLGSAGAFEDALPREISTARRHGRSLCLIQIDLDDFGQVNKQHGQAAGDEVLTEFGRRLRSTIRGSDSAFRNSGGADEFYVILPETSREEAIRSYARLAFEMAAAPFGAIGSVTMSSGLVQLRAEDTPDSLKARADRLVYRAKDEGKDRLLSDDEV